MKKILLAIAAISMLSTSALALSKADKTRASHLMLMIKQERSANDSARLRQLEREMRIFIDNMSSSHSGVSGTASK
jgi:hypothetical protein